MKKGINHTGNFTLQTLPATLLAQIAALFATAFMQYTFSMRRTMRMMACCCC